MMKVVKAAMKEVREGVADGVLDDPALFVRLFDALPEPVVCVGTTVPAEPVVVYANAAATRLLLGDRSADAETDLTGCSLAALPGAMARQVLVPLCRDVLERNGPGTKIEVPLPADVVGLAASRPKRPDIRGYLEVHAQPVRDPATGRITAVLFVLRDVTERVLLREAYRAADEKARVLARALQTDVLVHENLGTIPGYRLAVSYRSMDREHDLGGDFFDGFRLGPTTFGLALGDVCGKGLGAVLDTALVKFFLKAFARDARQPADVLTKTHRAAREEPRFENFATAFYGLLDTQNHALTWTNAAHEPPLHVRAQTGALEALPASGVPLGLALVEWPGYEQRVTDLRPGDLLVLYTDGVTEARSLNGEHFGAERLRALVQTFRDKEPASLVRRIEEQIAAFTGGKQTDDRILVCLKRDA